jgi:hypothetical protein
MSWMLAAVLTAQVGGVGMVTVAHDLMSGVDTAQQTVVQDETAWARLWRAHAGDSLPPPVDFSSHTVLAVFLGSRPSGGFDVEITAVGQEGAATLVEWIERRPGPGEMTAAVMTSPAHMVAVPKLSGEIRFVRAGGR